jgi:hypothetical protein
MKLEIGYKENRLKVEAESVVQAIIKLLDSNYGAENTMEFEIKKINDNCNS